MTSIDSPLGSVGRMSDGITVRLLAPVRAAHHPDGARGDIAPNISVTLECIPMNKQERYFHLAAKANRERLALAHRELIMQEELKKAVEVRQNMARLKALRLARETQEIRTEISEANQPSRPNSKKRFR
jgi:outer membrane PBP1 activator LpoA protein